MGQISCLPWNACFRTLLVSHLSPPQDLECLDFILGLIGPEKLAGAVYFDISHAQVKERLLGRLACSKCELNYHRSLPGAQPVARGQCDACKGPLAPRLDDTKATVARRLDSFDAKTRPVVDRLRTLGLLETVDASLSPYLVNKQVMPRHQDDLRSPELR